MTPVVDVDDDLLLEWPRSVAVLIDAIFVLGLVLTVAGITPVFAFHMSFAMLMVMSVIHAGRNFVRRALVGYVATVAAVVASVRIDHLLSDELYELPILTAMIGFAIWAMQQLRRLIDRLSHQSARIRHLHAASRVEHREQLLVAQRLETVGHLSASLAHDLRNGLTTIVAMAEQIEDSTADPRVAEAAVRIQGQTARGGELLSQLLRQANPRGSTDPAELGETIRAQAPTLDIAIGRNIELVLDLGPEPLVVRPSQAMMEQLLVNLVLNSARATPDDGTIVVSAKRGLLPPQVPGQSATEAAVLAVADDGVGMTPEVRLRAFDAFYSTDTQGVGAGLGLYSALLIVEAGGGTIHVTPDREVGCEVVATLPLVSAGSEITPEAGTGTDAEVPPDSEPALAPARARRVPGGLARVLLADDDDIIRESLERTLVLGGYEVTVSRDGREALDQLRASTFDLLVTDVVMPYLRGPDLVEVARRDGIAPPVLFISSHDQAAELVGPGAALLAKPFSRSLFLVRVQQMLPSPEAARATSTR